MAEKMTSGSEAGPAMDALSSDATPGQNLPTPESGSAQPLTHPSRSAEFPQLTRWPTPPKRHQSATKEKKKKKKKKKRRSAFADTETDSTATTSASTSTTISNQAMPPPPPRVRPGKIVPLFIASIGNPAPTYANTLHSAGHTVLEGVRVLRNFEPFRKERQLGNGLVSRLGPGVNFSWFPFLGGGSDKDKEEKRKKAEEVARAAEQEDWTLWQSPSLMNVSGKALGQAWGRWKKEHAEGQLVVVHDELEQPLGKVVMRRGGSARGHNGLKSIVTQLTGMRYVRIGVGIGRPQSREPDAVASYVLRKMTEKEQYVIEGTAGDVIHMLRDVQEGKI